MLADRMRMSFRNLLGKLNITIDHTKIDSTLTNYPIMVKLDETNFDFSKVREDGKGIRFKDSNGNYLAHEVEYFTTNKAIFHVKVPTVSSTVDTKIKMEYSLADETDYSDKTNVWDSNFVMVQHMGESLVDSTGNGNDGTSGKSTIVDGLNGKARSFNGSSNYHNIPLSNSLKTNYLTVSSLAYNSKWRSSLSTRIVSCTEAGGYNGASLNDQTGHLATVVNKQGTYYISKYPLSSLQTSGWYLNNGTFDGVYLKTYLDASNVDTINTGSSNTIKYPTQVFGLTIGAEPGTSNITGNYYNGIIEEVRISNIARSDAWIKADDYNLRQNNLITIE